MKEKTLKVGVLGLGRAGQLMHLKEMSKYPECMHVIAGCDIDAERRKAAHEKYPDIKIYSKMKDLINDPELDVITIATRSPMHVRHAIAALEAGKYVVCEKPVTSTVAQMMKLKAASEKYPGKLFIRHNRRFEKAFCHIREIIASGILGEIYEIKLRRHNYQWRTDWQTIKSCWGGQLLNWGPHLIDHALQFLESPVESLWSDLKLIAAYGDAEDHFKLLLRGTNGRIVDVEVSGGVPLKEAVYCVHGTRGTLISQDEKTIKMRYLRSDREIPQHKSTSANPPLNGGFGVPVPDEWWVNEEIPVAPACGEDINRQFYHVWESIVLKKPYPIKFEEALEVVRVAEKARKTKIDNFRDRAKAGK